MNDDSQTVLKVEELTVEFDAYGGVVQAVRGVDFSVERGRTLCLVGESGCGKSVAMQAIMGLLPTPPGRISGGSARLDGREILGLRGSQAADIRGRELAMIFQDPMTSLNPTMRIGQQIAEVLQVKMGLDSGAARAQSIELIDRTRIPDAEQRAQQYPFQFSGGMLQRAMIAMSLACNPRILIADEPTTALDVTIQAQILDLMQELQSREGMAIILITHDLGVVARMADRVAVMYAGQIVEAGTADEIFYRSAHPYTLGLQQAMPSNDEHGLRQLLPIAGSPPDLFNPPPGCGYFPRCPQAMRLCQEHAPERFNLTATHHARCWLQHEQAPRMVRNNGISHTG